MKWLKNIFRKRNSKSTRSNTGYKGITRHSGTGKFQAQVSIYKRNNDGKMETVTLYSKSCTTVKEAVKAREDYINNIF